MELAAQLLPNRQDPFSTPTFQQPGKQGCKDSHFTDKGAEAQGLC
jgi:hypothetical protein